MDPDLDTAVGDTNAFGFDLDELERELLLPVAQAETMQETDFMELAQAAIDGEEETWERRMTEDPNEDKPGFWWSDSIDANKALPLRLPGNVVFPQHWDGLSDEAQRSLVEGYKSMWRAVSSPSRYQLYKLAFLDPNDPRLVNAGALPQRMIEAFRSEMEIRTALQQRVVLLHMELTGDEFTEGHQRVLGSNRNRKRPMGPEAAIRPGRQRARLGTAEGSTADPVVATLVTAAPKRRAARQAQPAIAQIAAAQAQVYAADIWWNTAGKMDGLITLNPDNFPASLKTSRIFERIAPVVNKGMNLWNGKSYQYVSKRANGYEAQSQALLPPAIRDEKGKSPVFSAGKFAIEAMGALAMTIAFVDRERLCRTRDNNSLRHLLYCMHDGCKNFDGTLTMTADEVAKKWLSEVDPERPFPAKATGGKGGVAVDLAPAAVPSIPILEAVQGAVDQNPLPLPQGFFQAEDPFQDFQEEDRQTLTTNRPVDGDDDLFGEDVDNINVEDWMEDE